MKVRTEARRDAILEVASKAFMEMGFERTSMAEIAARVGGSKATLYGYFPSKEALFVGVTQAAGMRHLGEAVNEIEAHDGGDVEAALRSFGETLLTFIYSPPALAAHRMVVAEAAHSDIGRMFYDAGPKRGLETMTAFMRKAMQRGHLRESDPVVAAHHFLGLVTSENDRRWFVRDAPPLTRQQIKATVARAVTAFLSGYAAAGG